MNRITTAMIAAALISRRDDAAVCNPMASLPDIDVKALVAEYGTGKPNRAQRRGNVHGHLGRKPGPARRR